LPGATSTPLVFHIGSGHFQLSKAVKPVFQPAADGPESKYRPVLRKLERYHDASS
jgi:hypothetical protein